MSVRTHTYALRLLLMYTSYRQCWCIHHIVDIRTLIRMHYVSCWCIHNIVTYTYAHAYVCTTSLLSRVFVCHVLCVRVLVDMYTHITCEAHTWPSYPWCDVDLYIIWVYYIHTHIHTHIHSSLDACALCLICESVCVTCVLCACCRGYVYKYVYICVCRL